jgi:hypothetical protein
MEGELEMFIFNECFGMSSDDSSDDDEDILLAAALVLYGNQ